MHSLLFLDEHSFDIQETDFVQLRSQAYFNLGRLNGLVSDTTLKKICQTLPMTVIESVKSSNIENINSTILDQLESSIKNRKSYSSEQKITENYRTAMIAGYDYLKENHTFDLGLILVIQKSLMPECSEIRDNEPVVIANTSSGEVLWRPPIGTDVIIEYLNNWFDTLTLDIDPVVMVGVLHSQFEAIHPFVDGNGRVGRILIVLFLIYKGLIDYPCIFISDYILKSRTYYYLALQESQTQGNHSDIIHYIANAISQKAEFTINLILQIQEQKRYFAQKIMTNAAVLYSEKLIDYLFETPFYSISGICEYLGISRNTGSLYLKHLVEFGLIQVKDSRKNKIFYNHTFLSILTI
jgi:Fic family protein